MDGHHQATIVEQEEKELGQALLKHAGIGMSNILEGLCPS